MDLREQILDTATQLFRTHGLNFTMQQVASSLHISKKTIYTVYPGKEALLTDMVDMLFARIHQKKSELAAGTDPLEKRLYAVLTALPEEYAALDFRRLDELEEKYPNQNLVKLVGCEVRYNSKTYLDTMSYFTNFFRVFVLIFICFLIFCFFF